MWRSGNPHGWAFFWAEIWEISGEIWEISVNIEKLKSLLIWEILKTLDNKKIVTYTVIRKFYGGDVDGKSKTNQTC